MHVENITSNAMSLDRNGQSMLIQVYEKEIDRLNNKVLELENINEKIGLALDSAENKVDRLNNIINELEKWIKENNLGEYRTENVVDTDELLDKLKELKENNK